MPDIDIATIALPPGCGIIAPDRATQPQQGPLLSIYTPIADCSATIPADLPTNKVSPLTSEPFDVDAYLKRLADREAEELARQHALPTAHHKATIVDGIQKVLLPDGFAKLPLGAERWELFAMVVATVNRWADK